MPRNIISTSNVKFYPIKSNGEFILIPDREVELEYLKDAKGFRDKSYGEKKAFVEKLLNYIFPEESYKYEKIIFSSGLSIEFYYTQVLYGNDFIGYKVFDGKECLFKYVRNPYFNKKQYMDELPFYKKNTQKVALNHVGFVVENESEIVELLKILFPDIKINEKDIINLNLKKYEEQILIETENLKICLTDLHKRFSIIEKYFVKIVWKKHDPEIDRFYEASEKFMWISFYLPNFSFI